MKHDLVGYFFDILFFRRLILWFIVDAQPVEFGQVRNVITKEDHSGEKLIRSKTFSYIACGLKSRSVAGGSPILFLVKCEWGYLFSNETWLGRLFFSTFVMPSFINRIFYVHVKCRQIFYKFALESWTKSRIRHDLWIVLFCVTHNSVSFVLGDVRFCFFCCVLSRWIPLQAICAVHDLNTHTYR